MGKTFSDSRGRPEAPLLDHPGEVAVRRGDHADVELDRRVPPTRSNSCSCRTRRSFGWSSSGISPTSSRKERAAAAPPRSDRSSARSRR
jgi:hypothetical protein